MKYVDFHSNGCPYAYSTAGVSVQLSTWAQSLCPANMSRDYQCFVGQNASAVLNFSLNYLLPQNVVSYCLNLGNIFLWSFSKLSLDTVAMLKSLAFQNCLIATGTCQSICLLQSKYHEQEPEEILISLGLLCLQAEAQFQIYFQVVSIGGGRLRSKVPESFVWSWKCQSIQALQFCFAEHRLVPWM